MSSANVPGRIASILKRVFGLTRLRRVSKPSSTRCFPVNRLMSRYAVARVAADPSVTEQSDAPWYTFDNTASGAASENAWEPQQLVR
jgi:hypothetical protein